VNPDERLQHLHARTRTFRTELESLSARINAQVQENERCHQSDEYPDDVPAGTEGDVESA